MRRRGGTRAASLRRMQDGRQRVWGDLAAPHVRQRPRDRADHLVEEAVAHHVDREDRRSARERGRLGPDTHRVERADAVAVAVGAADEGAEVAAPLEVRRRRPHGGEVERLGHVPGAGRLERAARRLGEDPVAIVLATRREAGVKLGGHLAHAAHDDVGREERVEAEVQPLEREVAPDRDAGHLPQRVHARVGAARAGDPRRRAQQLAQRALDLALRRAAVGLQLPAREVGPRVLDHQLQMPRRRGRVGAVSEFGHGPSLAPGVGPEPPGRPWVPLRPSPPALGQPGGTVGA